MSSPTNSGFTSSISNSGNKYIDALVGDYVWGASGSGRLGGTQISYSFPWINGKTANFSGFNGGVYSKAGEPNAVQHFGFNNLQQQAAIMALSKWSNIANISFVQISESATSVGDIRMAFSSAESLDGWWGYAYAPYPNNPISGDIWINAKYGNDSDWSIGSQNFLSLMHEIGHALGLSHPFDKEVKLDKHMDTEQYTVMSYTEAANSIYPSAGYINGVYSWITYQIVPETPMVLDIAAMHYMYGANDNYQTGDDIYQFDPTVPFLKTIWDAAGNDTISVSNFTLACEINLNPGSYSSIRYPKPADTGGAELTYNGTENLGIAYNCIIENAIGGFGNDKIIGNNSNNSLDGGPGDDIILGGDGNDIFDWNSNTRTGNDSFYGGKGNDVFVIDSDGDVIYENLNEGLDTVWSPFSYSISLIPNVENIFGFGVRDLTLVGNSLSNYIRGSGGDDFVDGGLGMDIYILDGSHSQFGITKTKEGFIVKDKVGAGGTDNLANIERLLFSDKKSISLDLSGNAGEVAKILGAVFGKNAVKNEGYFGIGLYYKDNGMKYADLGQLAASAAGLNSYDALVSQLWFNIVGTKATETDKAPYINLLKNGMSVGDLVVFAAETELNKVNIDLVGLSSTGALYQPFSG